MRWTEKKPKEGNTRIIKRFLMWPECNGDKWRWLETVSVRQRYRYLGEGEYGWWDEETWIE